MHFISMYHLPIKTAFGSAVLLNAFRSFYPMLKLKASGCEAKALEKAYHLVSMIMSMSPPPPSLPPSLISANCPWENTSSQRSFD